MRKELKYLNNSEKGELSRKNEFTLFQDLLYSYNNQDCVVSVEEQMHRSTEDRTQRRPHKYAQEITDKGAKSNSLKEIDLFNKRCWNN